MANSLTSCKNCVLNHSNICAIFKEPVNPNSTCPKFTNQLFICDICGSQMLPKDVILSQNEDNYDIVCQNCAKEYGKCSTCANSSVCDFETNPINIPKYVNQTVRQGNMVAQTTVKNPSRVDETCRKNCPCFDQILGCLKENRTCGKWEKLKK